MIQFFQPGRPIMGDLLRVALWCARRNPASPASVAVWQAFDKALSCIAAAPISRKEIQERIRALEAPWIAPVIIEDHDWPLLLRIVSACRAFGYSSFNIGSADALGFGYGIHLAQRRGDDKYFERSAPAETPSVHLGLRPAALTLANFDKQPLTRMSFEDSGLTISVEVSHPKLRGFNLELNSWIVDLGRRAPTSSTASRASSFNYGMSETETGWSLGAKTPESAIRLAMQCAAGALFGFVPDDRIGGDYEAILTFLRPADEAPTYLAAERHSRSGPLADWLRIPPLPIVLELDTDSCAALNVQSGARAARKGETI